MIVVGAGPAGLALSLALARLGVPSLLLDSRRRQATPRAARTCVLRPDTAAWLPAAPGDWAALRGAAWTRWRTRRRQQLVQDVE